MLALALLSLTCCGPNVVYLSDEEINTQPPVASLPDGELEGFVRQFYVEDLGVESPEIAQSSGRQSMSELRDFLVTWDSKRRKSHVTVDSTSGVVLRYDLLFAEWEHYPEEDRKKLETRGYLPMFANEPTRDKKNFNESESEAIATVPWGEQYEIYSQEAAFNQIESLLRYLKQPLDMGMYSITSREVTGHGRWRFRIAFQHDGVPFIGKLLSVDVSKYSGTIVAITHEPITNKPQTPEKSISKSEALDVAVDSISRNEHFKWRLIRGYQWAEVDYDVNSQDILKVIVLPKSISSMHKSEKKYIDELSPNEPRYCWKVPFAYAATDSNELEIPIDSTWFVYVDVETGRVVR